MKSILERLLFLTVGSILMILGLGLGVTMMLLPVGLAIGLIGVLTFVTGLTYPIE